MDGYSIIYQISIWEIYVTINVSMEGDNMRKLSKEERMLQELYGYTDEQLLEDARLAEEELARMGGGEAITEEEIADMLRRAKELRK